MKKATTFLFFILAVFMLKAQTPLTYERMPQGYVEKWIEERMASTKKNLRETVEMPLVVRSMGWGCSCPMHYIGVGTTTQEGPWIAPLLPDDFQEVGEEGLAFVVTGYFTGKWITEDLRNADGEPAEYLYKMPEFKIVSWKLNDMDYSVNAPRVIKTEKVQAPPKEKKKKTK